MYIWIVVETGDSPHENEVTPCSSHEKAVEYLQGTYYVDYPGFEELISDEEGGSLEMDDDYLVQIFKKKLDGE